jgi:hypothetical protein
MNYAYFLSTLGGLLQYTDTNDPNFAPMIQAIVNGGEQRIYRELDFLAVRTSNFSLSFTANSRTLDITPLLSLATGPIIRVTGLGVVTPSLTAPNVGNRNRVKMIADDVLDFLYPQESVTTGLPRFGALSDNKTILVGPTPNAAYVAEVKGVYRPTPLSAANPTSYISTYYPDLLVAACMVFSTGYQRDFGAMSDDPKMAISWESHYQTLKESCIAEEKRRKGESEATQATPPVPLTNPNPG